jgi:predicted RNase H-like nuclease (RuvC/YqgF family)
MFNKQLEEKINELEEKFNQLDKKVEDELFEYRGFMFTPIKTSKIKKLKEKVSYQEKIIELLLKKLNLKYVRNPENEELKKLK